MPANPAGMVELSEAELDLVVGGGVNKPVFSNPGSGCGTHGGNTKGGGTGKGTRRCTVKA
jgi:hypothetical protein